MLWFVPTFWFVLDRLSIAHPRPDKNWSSLVFCPFCATSRSPVVGLNTTRELLLPPFFPPIPREGRFPACSLFVRCYLTFPSFPPRGGGEGGETVLRVLVLVDAMLFIYSSVNRFRGGGIKICERIDGRRVMMQPIRYCRCHSLSPLKCDDY